MNHLLFAFFLIATSIAIAAFEVQIEGKNGWASALPTKRFNKIPLGDNKVLTGYHLSFWILALLLTHTAFLFTQWSLSKELFLLSFGAGVLSLEDFLWFVINPHYGIKKYNKENVTWHKGWTFGIANVNIFFALVSAGIYYLAMITG